MAIYVDLQAPLRTSSSLTPLYHGKSLNSVASLTKKFLSSYSARKPRNCSSSHLKYFSAKTLSFSSSVAVVCFSVNGVSSYFLTLTLAVLSGSVPSSRSLISFSLSATSLLAASDASSFVFVAVTALL